MKLSCLLKKKASHHPFHFPQDPFSTVSALENKRELPIPMASDPNSVSLFPARGSPSPPPTPPPTTLSPSGSLLIRAPLSTDDNDDRRTIPDSAASGSDADSFLSGEDEEEFDSASERLLVADPDEEDFDLGPVTGSSGGFVLPSKASMPKAQLSGEDDDFREVSDEEFVDEVDGDGFSAAVTVLPADVGEESPAVVDEGEVFDDGDTLPQGLGGESNPEVTSEDRVLALDEKEPVEDMASVETVNGGGSGEVGEGEFLAESPSVAKVAAAESAESTKLDDGVAESSEEKGVSVDGIEDVGEPEPDGVSDEVMGSADVPKPVEAFSDVSEAEPAIGGMDDSKPTETTPDVIEAEEPIAASGERANSSKPIEAAVDAQKNGVHSHADQSLEHVSHESESLKTEGGMGEVEEDEVLGLVSDLADSSIAQEPASDVGIAVDVVDDNHLVKLEGAGEEPMTEPERASADLEANAIEQVLDSNDDGGKEMSTVEVEPLKFIAEDSKDSQMDRDIPEISSMAEDGNINSVSILDRQVKSDGLASFIADDEKEKTLNEAGEVVEEEEEEEAGSEGPPRVAILESSEDATHFIKGLDEGSSATSSGFGSSRDFSRQIDRQIVSDSDEEVETDEEGDGKGLFDSAAFAALLKAASRSSADGSSNITTSDVVRLFSADRPAGLGSSAPPLKPAPPRAVRPNLSTPSDLIAAGETEDNMDEEEKRLHEKVERIRVKFLRLVHRMGHSPADTVAAQVLYRLGLAEGLKHGRQTSRPFRFESAKKKALQLEEDGKEDLEFSCNILVLGKTGAGKSATINSILGEKMAHTDAFRPATTCVKEIVGVVDGVKIRFIDTPGLRTSVMDQASNKRILSSIKKYTKKFPPDIMLYVDRLDAQTRDFNDLPLLQSIASELGSTIWFNAIVALTHAASAPPDGPGGMPLSYDVFVAQRSHVVQHSIRQAVRDMRLMNPVALVENHPSCRKNREGQRVLPNGISWRPQLLLLCYSSKILAEANSLLKLQEPSPGKLSLLRVRLPQLPSLLSSLLQSRPYPKLATDQGGDNGDSDLDLEDLSDSDQEEEDEYDQLPPFKPLQKSQVAMLTKEQRKAYFDEYDYRVKLLQKKQWKEELKRLKEVKRGKVAQDDLGYGDMADDYDQDGAPAAVPVPLPDMVLPPTFDCDNPAYRYRFLEPTSQLLARPVLDTHGWDHDCGYDGVSLEESLAIAGRFPAAVAVQITKDKKEFNIHLDSSVSAKYAENGSSLAGFDIQTVGRQLAYTLRSETKFKNLKKNKTTAGISVTFLGENIATGLKVEDQVLIGKRVSLAASTGAVRAQGDTAYGANLEARLRDKDYPVSQGISTLGISLMRWRRDLALGANLQSQFSVGRNLKMAVRVGLNNKLNGQITVRTSTPDQLQIALLGVLPVAISVFRSIWPGDSYLVQ